MGSAHCRRRKCLSKITLFKTFSFDEKEIFLSPWYIEWEIISQRKCFQRLVCGYFYSLLQCMKLTFIYELPCCLFQEVYGYCVARQSAIFVQWPVSISCLFLRNHIKHDHNKSENASKYIIFAVRNFGYD